MNTKSIWDRHTAQILNSWKNFLSMHFFLEIYTFPMYITNNRNIRILSQLPRWIWNTSGLDRTPDIISPGLWYEGQVLFSLSLWKSSGAFVEIHKETPAWRHQLILYESRDIMKIYLKKMRWRISEWNPEIFLQKKRKLFLIDK